MLVDIAATAQDTSVLVELELDLEPGRATPLHVHEVEESFHVLAGTLVVHVGDAWTELSAGETLTAPAHVPHALAGGPGGARFVASSRVHSVERYADFQRAAAVPDDLPEDVGERELVAWLARVNGITVLGPPGTLPAGAFRP